MPKDKLSPPTKILFIGNSFMQRNDLPLLIEQMAATAPTHRVVETERSIANGASLRLHWNKGEAVEVIHRGSWDYVVLQEQSTLPIKNSKRSHENVRLFDEEIKKSGAQTVLYLTWARQYAPETQDALNEATFAIAEELEALVVPVGPAWQAALHEDEGLALYDKDGSHPSQMGSYLAACVFVCTLLKQSPEETAIPDSIQIDHNCAGLIQRVAGQTVYALKKP